MAETEIVFSSLADAIQHARSESERTAQLEEVARSAATFLWACMNGEEPRAVLTKQNRLEADINRLQEIDSSIFSPIYDE